MSQAKELKTITGDLSVLYVEDDPAIREQLAQTLRLFFAQVWVAEDGKEGLDLYSVHWPDIVVSDIQMPRMNGLAMVRQIKEVNDRAPVILTTAFSDERYFLESIELGVDRYILKPVVQERFIAALLSVGRAVVDRIQAEAYAKRQIQNRINSATEQTLQEAINLYPNPTLIYSAKGEIAFMNDAFLELLDKEQIARLENQEMILSDLFEHREGFLNDLSLIDGEDYGRNRVSIRGHRGRKIFTVDSRSIAAAESAGTRIVYTLTDVTRLEYERQKGANLAAYLQDLLKLRKKQPAIPASVSADTPQTPAAPQSPEPKKALDAQISADERDVLRRSHVHKTNAADYVREIAGDVLDELEEMEEIEKELEELVHAYEESASDALLQEVAQRLRVYAKTVEKLFEFGDLAFALYQLAGFLDTLKSDQINTRKMGLLLGSLRLDLSSWRRMIFVTQEAQDIHYLDSSLFSSCLQIELDFGQKREDDENELDLF